MTRASQARRFINEQPHLFLALLVGLWVALYMVLTPMAEGFVSLLPIDQESHLAHALHFFIYDTPKVLLLLSGISFFMGMVHSYFTPERTRKLLSGRNMKAGNVFGALLGIVTPFCSCSAITLFIGFLQAGVPLGVTFSFLVSAPMVNEVALALLFGLFGWKVAALYLGLGLTIAITAGWIIGKLGLEHHLEDWVRDIQKVEAKDALPNLKLAQRIPHGFASTRQILGKTWIYIIAGIAVGAAIHGYVPEEFMASLMGKEAWWSVPAAVLIGVPMYSNAAGVLPIVQALIGKGAAMGTALAFMMAVVALSLPEMIILRRVMKPKLIGIFAGIVTSGILAVGYIFNAVL